MQILLPLLLGTWNEIIIYQFQYCRQWFSIRSFLSLYRRMFVNPSRPTVDAFLPRFHHFPRSRGCYRGRTRSTVAENFPSTAEARLAIVPSDLIAFVVIRLRIFHVSYNVSPWYSQWQKTRSLWNLPHLHSSKTVCTFLWARIRQRFRFCKFHFPGKIWVSNLRRKHLRRIGAIRCSALPYYRMFQVDRRICRENMSCNWRHTESDKVLVFAISRGYLSCCILVHTQPKLCKDTRNLHLVNK